MGGNDGHGDLEGRLRDARPSPPDELVTRLEADVARSAAPRTPSRLRFGLAVGFAGGFAALVAVVGGFGLLPGPSETPARATVAVPADAVPAIRSLQANGVRLAAHPALVAKRSSATGTITGGKVKVIEIDTERGSVGLIHADVPPGMEWGEFLARLEAGDSDAIQTCLWGRERVNSRDANGVAGVGRVFAGHTPQWSGAIRLGNFYCIDSGAVFGQLGMKEGHLTMTEATTKTGVLTSPRQSGGMIDLRIADDRANEPFGSYAQGAFAP